MAFWDFCQQQGTVWRGKRIRFLARSNLFLIVDWETLYGCGKFLSDSKPLEFQTVAWGLETHKVNLDFCGINESDCFLGRLWDDHKAACCVCQNPDGRDYIDKTAIAPAAQELWKAWGVSDVIRFVSLTSSLTLTVIRVSAMCLWGKVVTSPDYEIHRGILGSPTSPRPVTMTMTIVWSEML